MCRLCSQRRWLGVARHEDGCQLQLGLRATRYWLVSVKPGVDINVLQKLCNRV